MNSRPELRSKTEDDYGSHSQPVSAAAIREPPAADRSARSRSFAGAIVQLFREVKKAITGEAPAPQPKSKRRKDEDTRGLFKRACAILHPRETGRALFRLAGKTLHRTIQSAPVSNPLDAEAHAPAIAIHAGFDLPPWEILPDHDEHAEYLRILEMSQQEDFNPQHDNGGFHYAEAEHLSLNL